MKNLMIAFAISATLNILMAVQIVVCNKMIRSLKEKLKNMDNTTYSCCRHLVHDCSGNVSCNRGVATEHVRLDDETKTE